MSLNIGSALSGGFRRMANRNGLLLILAYVGIGTVWQIAFYSAVVTGIQRWGPPVDDLALPGIDAPFPVAVGGAILALLLLQWLTIVAIRTLVGGHSRSIPSEYYTRNILYVLVNSVVGGIVFGLVVFVGSILFIVPGIIAYIAFIFVLIYVAVEDVSFVAGFRRSWTLTRGHWLRLFLLFFLVVVGIGIVSGILSAVTSLVVGAVGGPFVGFVFQANRIDHRRRPVERDEDSRIAVRSRRAVRCPGRGGGRRSRASPDRSSRCTHRPRTAPWLGSLPRCVRSFRARSPSSWPMSEPSRRESSGPRERV